MKNASQFRNAYLLAHHLQYNHYPPVSLDWVPVCERAIYKAQAQLDTEAGQPAEFKYGGSMKVRRPKSHGGGLVDVWDVIEGLHLDSMLRDPWAHDEYDDSDEG